MINDFIYNSKTKSFDPYKPTDEDFVCSDFVEKYYSPWTAYPSRMKKWKDDSSGAFLTVHSIKHEFYGKFPSYLIDCSYSEGDILWFSYSWEVIEYLSSIMPLIEYTYKRMYTDNDEN